MYLLRVASRLPFLFGLALLTLLTAGPGMAQDIPADIVNLAQQALPSFLSKIPPGAREEYGFAPGDVLAQASLARPFKVYTINPATLLAAAPRTSVQAMLSETAMWYFPVMIQDEARAVLVVDQVNGQWQAVSLGYAHLARDLGEVRQRWPKARGFNAKLIALFQAKEHLVWVPEDNPNLLYGLGKPERGLRMEQAAGAMERLRSVVEESLKQGR